ncbi:MAG: HAD-IB family phosphatase [Ardenticatenaceae bacterium]|nr:HAD-IB family phosphatase [Ardenticatenaceae bacterium]MCB8989425.1 HAD-IB family phosphatase [Ardenticatenaceae bacterium]
MTEIVASDLEGTLTAGQTWRGMRSYLEEHGQAEAFRALYRRSLPSLILYRLKLVNERAFKERWILQILQLYAGYDAAAFGEMANWVVEQELWPRRRKQVLAELAAHQEAGRRVIVVSGLFQPILDVFTARIGCEGWGTAVSFDEHGRFTGHTAEPLNVGDKKVQRLRPLLQDGPLYAAYGDTIRDIPMLANSVNATAIRPDKRLRRVAEAREWRILG